MKTGHTVQDVRVGEIVRSTLNLQRTLVHPVPPVGVGTVSGTGGEIDRLERLDLNC